MAAGLIKIRSSGAALVRFEHGGGGPFLLRGAYPKNQGSRNADAEVFSALRKNSTPFFFDDAMPEPADVLRWVQNRYDSDDSQVNFYVTDETGYRMGFFGFSGIDHRTSRAEFGRVMKSADAPRGIMAAAIGEACVWLAETIGTRLIDLEVFADNAAAIRLYKRLGFQQTGVHYRQRETAGGHTKWVVCNAGGDARPVLEMTMNLDKWNNA